jgi:hypothetical protein
VTSSSRLWDREELLLLVDAYRQANGSSAGRWLAELESDLVGWARARSLEPRSRGSINFKLGNIKAVDTNGAAGFPHSSRLDAEVWNEFEQAPEAIAREITAIRSNR